MKNLTRAALAAAFAMTVVLVAGTAPAQETPAAPTAAAAAAAAASADAQAAAATADDSVEAPAAIPRPVQHVPVLRAGQLPLVYAPGPGYGPFTHAPTKMVCRPAPAPGARSGGMTGGVPGPVAGAGFGLLTYLWVAAVFL